jgi:hypothetical protein
MLATSGHRAPNVALENAPLQNNVVPALKTLKPDISSNPNHPPLAAAAGVLLLESHNLTRLYLHNRPRPDPVNNTTLELPVKDNFGTNLLTRLPAGATGVNPLA